MKFIGAAVAAFFFTFVLAGCGGGGGNSGSPLQIGPTPPTQVVAHAQVTLNPNDYNTPTVATIDPNGIVTPTNQQVTTLAAAAAKAGMSFTLDIIDPVGKVATIVATDPGASGVQYATLTSNSEVFHISYLRNSANSGDDELDMRSVDNSLYSVEVFPSGAATEAIYIRLFGKYSTTFNTDKQNIVRQVSIQRLMANLEFSN